MSAKNTATQVKKRSAGIRVKLVIALVAFTVLVLLAIWILQIRLLSYFYEREKFSELEETYLDICTYIGDKKFTDQLQKTAEENGICIRVFCKKQFKLWQMHNNKSRQRPKNPLRTL